MNNELFEIAWGILSEYLPKKDVQAICDHIVNELVDAGMDEDDLEFLGTIDNHLKRSVKDHLYVDDYDE